MLANAHMDVGVQQLSLSDHRRKPSDVADAGSRAKTPASPTSKDGGSVTTPSNLDWANTIRPQWPAPSARKRFGSSRFVKRSEKEENAEEDLRGPLGLRLLHSSPEPLVDVVFVHGLRGGSIKTWRKGDDRRFFWPQYWLPMEPGMRNASIHSFGYDSDWASTKTSILNVHDFGQSLLEQMRNSPYIRGNGNNPIILVGHSMGGLVIKKAFILSRDTADFEGRIKCFFFLATPHRGSDYAAILNNILNVSGIMSSRHYISDIMTGSASSQLINEEFAERADDLMIYSFYETLRMNLGITSAMIVERSSAILGYKNERVQYLNANHRDVCKFGGVEDPNYIAVRDALQSAIQDLLKDVAIRKAEESKKQMRLLQVWLGITDRAEGEYPKVDGSCQWINAREDFCAWRDSSGDYFTQQSQEREADHKSISLFWVHANPGTGKTYLANYIATQLQEFQLECASYYFHFGDRSSKSVGDLLRRMAYQMASSNAAIRNSLVALYRDGSTFDKDDTRTVWNKVFRRGIFQTHIYAPQYWVIDALDECNRYQELFSMLKGERPNFPLHIFITSRKIPDILRLTRTLEATATISILEIPQSDSIADIECYIRTRIDDLPVDSIADREELARNILVRSNACFLWVRLVLDELEYVYSRESMLQVLQGIPDGMLPYYERTIHTMSENKLEKHIAKAVLTWVVTTSRKITLSELSHALKLDINAVLPSAKTAVEGLCGHLVSVDQVSGVIDVVHATAREFLWSEAAGEFSVSESKGHERIALVCLKLLSSHEMQPPRSRRWSTQKQRRPEPSALLDYAITHFSEHICGASAEAVEVLKAINLFFRTNVLTWIERVAEMGDLHYIIRASKNLKAYSYRGAKYHSLLNGQVNDVGSWAADLSRLVTKFGAALLQNPSSIHFLIPPLCPSNTAIYRQFGRRPDSPKVLGFKSKTWDDCIASVCFDDDMAAAASCGENLIAVGMESGYISLYNHRSCQKEGGLHLKHPIDFVHFADENVAACTTKSTTLVDIEGNILWETKNKFRCILLTSSDDHVIAVSQHGHLLKWAMTTGELVEDQLFAFRPFEGEIDQEKVFDKNKPFGRVPSVASFSPDKELLALGYRGGTVCILETQTAEPVAWARNEEFPELEPFKVMFNPNPDIDLLLVIYVNGDMALYDTWSGNLVHSFRLEDSCGLLSASCSPDGRTLSICNVKGCIQLWDFESLTLFYYVISPFPCFRILDFTSDGLSIADVMDGSMRIWSPATLIRNNAEEHSNIIDDITTANITEGQYQSDNSARFVATCVHPTLPVVLVGKYNGEVVAFSTKTGQQTSVLYSHLSTAFITQITISIAGYVASSDVSRAIQVWSLVPEPSSSLKAGSIVLRKQFSVGAQVRQLCFNASGEVLLVATTQTNTIYSMKDGSCIATLDFSVVERKIWRWLAIGEHDFALIADGTLKRHIFPDFLPPDDNSDIHLQYELPSGTVETNLGNAMVHPETHILILEVQHRANFVSSSTTFLFRLDEMVHGPPGATLESLYNPFSQACRQFVAINQQNGSLVFLHRSGWLSSVDLKGLVGGHYAQHFFIPREYLDNGGVLPAKTAEGDIVLYLDRELSIIKNGLGFADLKSL
ncbi:putative NACHT and WD domain protein [Seiridium cardinale]|uniref:GPI inositol-deacylase n=1 Tax=Seiridium cardinale TaxID=138064 RepID=A0ABR2XXS4_9PEZI